MFTAILPYVEQAAVWNAVNFSFGAIGDAPEFGVVPGQVQATALQARISTFICPSETSEMTARNADQSDRISGLPDVLRGGRRLQRHHRLVVGMSVFHPARRGLRPGLRHPAQRSHRWHEQHDVRRRGEPVQERGRSLV